MELQVTDNPDESRFEIRADGELAGFVQYHLRGRQIAFIHTETDDRFRGHGLASQLVREALDAARAAPDRAALLPVRAELDRRPSRVRGPGPARAPVSGQGTL